MGWLCAVLAACSSDADDEVFDWTFHPQIQFFSMYSVFGGSHSYAVTPFLPGADPASKDSDPIVASKVRWEVDEKLVKREAFPDLPADIKLTTKAVGRTTVRVTMTSLSGFTDRSSASLHISEANDELWEKGDARYARGAQGDFAPFLETLAMPLSEADAGPCELPSNILAGLPKDVSCQACHEQFGARVSPAQTAGYSDEQLTSIIAQGLKPPGYQFNSVPLRTLPQPDCLFAKFHAFEMDEETQRGLIAKLRSLPPEK